MLWVHLLVLLSLLLLPQVTCSQTLGVIGYSLLPLLMVAPIISLLHHYPWVAFLIKVRGPGVVEQCHALSSPIPGFGGGVGILQCRILAGQGGTETQEAPLAVPHLPPLCLPPLSLHWSMTPSTLILQMTKKYFHY